MALAIGNWLGRDGYKQVESTNERNGFLGFGNKQAMSKRGSG
jgi:hypothetical protein